MSSTDEGRLVPPYPFPTCSATDCGRSTLNETDGAYLHRNRETGKFVVLCGGCSQAAQLTASLRLPLVVL